MTVRVRHLSEVELLARKAKLEAVLEILTEYDTDSVCQELGEISYLLGGFR